MSYQRTQDISLYGWDAVPRDMDVLLSQYSQVPATLRGGDRDGNKWDEEKGPKVIKFEDIRRPDLDFDGSEKGRGSEVCKKVFEYARLELSEETFNHCLRVFYYGQAILTHYFPTWSTPTFNETYFLSCLLHDIGTTDKNIHSTLLSFEFHGGLLAYELLRKENAPISQTENVVEAIIRHQDIGSEGMITRIGALLQLSTIHDNLTPHPNLVAKQTILEVTKAYPRKNWSRCFAATIRRENGLKPWAHTTVLGEEEFPEGVEGNVVMGEFE